MSSDRKQIYIVDDDESVARAIRSLLAMHGFSVRTFNSAEDFFSAVPNSSPGCLILDLYLPGLNGWKAQERLNVSGSKRPIIVITADKNDGLKERALQTGAAGFLQKPFHDQELIELINSAFQASDSPVSNNRVMSLVDQS